MRRSSLLFDKAPTWTRSFPGCSCFNFATYTSYVEACCRCKQRVHSHILTSRIPMRMRGQYVRKHSDEVAAA